MHVVRAMIVIGVWLAAICGAGMGAFTLVTGLAGSTGAPQQAAVAGIACAFAILPYCFARAITEMLRSLAETAEADRQRNERKASETTRIVTPEPEKSRAYNYERQGIR